MPSVSEIPSIFNSIRHPKRSRSVSVGPQSEADAYETLAFRERRRRQSKNEGTSNASQESKRISAQQSVPDYFALSTSKRPNNHSHAGGLPTPAASNSDIYSSMTEIETAIYTPPTPGSMRISTGSNSRGPSAERRQNEKEEREIFSKLEKPRVRYDVEVITKLIVYTGIAWISVEGAPILFELVGLTPGPKPD